jgi:hypothetical protein
MTLVLDGINGVTSNGVVYGSYPNYVGFKNKIINGGFDHWQRSTGSSGTLTPDNTRSYVNADRWGHFSFSGDTGPGSGRQAFTLGQTEVPGNPRYFLRKNYSSAPGGGQTNGISQRLEFLNRFSGKTMTLSFWGKCGDNTKYVIVEFLMNFGTGGSPSTAINSLSPTPFLMTTTWQKFTVTVDIPSISGKSFGTGLNDYLEIMFWHGGTVSSRNAFYNLSGQQGIFDMAQVQFEEGSDATDFEKRSPQLEFQLCQRFYQTFPYKWGTVNQNAAANTFNMSVHRNGLMRGTPTDNVAGTSQTGGTMSGLGSSATSGLLQFVTTAAQNSVFFTTTIQSSSEL